MDKRIRLYVLGLSFSQLQSGAYALVLAEESGPRRIPVVIGAAEAQSIAICLEGIRTPRPLTHDLFVSFAHAFGVSLTEVYIYRFEDGIFSSELTFSDGERTIRIDARTSDAISIAMRTHAPIYTTEDIIQRTGFIIDDTPDEGDGDGAQRLKRTAADDDAGEATPDDGSTRDESQSLIEGYSQYFGQLEKELADLIANEKYEEAAQVSDSLNQAKREVLEMEVDFATEAIEAADAWNDFKERLRRELGDENQQK